MDHDHRQHDTAATASGSSAEIDHSDRDHGSPKSAAAAADDNPESHEDGHGGHGADGHDHPPLVVPTDQPAPSIAITVTPDPVSGWNLQLQTTNFEFAPERVNGESTFDEGHAHLFVNGEKRGRIYSNWHHITDLAPGENLIRVTLNSNGHEAFIVEDEVVADEVMVTVP